MIRSSKTRCGITNHDLDTPCSAFLSSSPRVAVVGANMVAGISSFSPPPHSLAGCNQSVRWPQLQSLLGIICRKNQLICNCKHRTPLTPSHTLKSPLVHRSMWDLSIMCCAIWVPPHIAKCCDSSIGTLTPIWDMEKLHISDGTLSILWIT